MRVKVVIRPSAKAVFLSEWLHHLACRSDSSRRMMMTVTKLYPAPHPPNSSLSTAVKIATSHYWTHWFLMGPVSNGGGGGGGGCYARPGSVRPQLASGCNIMRRCRGRGEASVSRSVASLFCLLDSSKEKECGGLDCTTLLNGWGKKMLRGFLAGDQNEMGSA